MTDIDENRTKYHVSVATKGANAPIPLDRKVPNLSPRATEKMVGFGGRGPKNGGFYPDAAAPLNSIRALSHIFADARR